jgi:endonuclease/exonuclease/phosphatase family metal-dependent hydrolase
MGVEAAEERNLIVLGDLNIDERGDNPLFQAFVSMDLVVPAELLTVKTTYASQAKYYDHIAWFRGPDFTLAYMQHAGSIDFSGAVFKELTLAQLSYRLSDHLPLWVELHIDRSAEAMGRALGLTELQLGAPDSPRLDS